MKFLKIVAAVFVAFVLLIVGIVLLIGAGASKVSHDINSDAATAKAHTTITSPCKADQFGLVNATAKVVNTTKQKRDYTVTVSEKVGGVQVGTIGFVMNGVAPGSAATDASADNPTKTKGIICTVDSVTSFPSN